MTDRTIRYSFDEAVQQVGVLTAHYFSKEKDVHTGLNVIWCGVDCSNKNAPFIAIAGPGHTPTIILYLSKRNILLLTQAVSAANAMEAAANNPCLSSPEPSQRNGEHNHGNRE
jgi:hypothetical protein